MTMGIVFVACLAARNPATRNHENVDLILHQFGHKAGDTFRVSFTRAILNLDIFALNISAIL